MKFDSNYNPHGKDVVSWEYGQEAGRCRDLDPDILFKNLCEVKKVFDKYNIKFCLSHGTCLGAVRDNNFILWDDDADLWVDFSQRDLFKKVEKDLRKLGYWVPKSDPKKPISKNNAPYYDFVAIKDGEKIECWFFEKFGNEYIYDKPRCGRDLAHPAHFYDTLDTITFRGVEFNVPHDVNEYLVMMYGKDYMIPNPNKKYNNQS